MIAMRDTCGVPVRESEGEARPLGAGIRAARPAGPVLAVAVATTFLVVGFVIPSFNFFSDPSQYLVLHTALEFISIAISLMVFALAMSLRGSAATQSVMVLGSASLSIAMIDFAHTLSFAGMPEMVTLSGPEKAINFWLAGRLVAALALLAVAILPERPCPDWQRVVFPLAGLLFAMFVYWVGLYHADWLPRTFLEGSGLTPAKVIAEYGLVAIYLLAAVLLWRRSIRGPVVDLAVQWLAAAAVTLALAEMFFTLYSSVTDTNNLFGHICKTAAYLMIYRAIFVEGVQRPYRQLDKERIRLRSLIDSVPDQIALRNSDGAIIAVNRAFQIFEGPIHDELDDVRPQPAPVELHQQILTGADGSVRLTV